MMACLSACPYSSSYGTVGVPDAGSRPVQLATYCMLRCGQSHRSFPQEIETNRHRQVSSVPVATGERHAIQKEKPTSTLVIVQHPRPRAFATAALVPRVSDRAPLLRQPNEQLSSLHPPLVWKPRGPATEPNSGAAALRVLPIRKGRASPRRGRIRRSRGFGGPEPSLEARRHGECPPPSPFTWELVLKTSHSHCTRITKLQPAPGPNSYAEWNPPVPVAALRGVSCP